MPKAKRTAKQIAASTKNILRYEYADDAMNFMRGFVLGAVGVLIISLVVMSV